MERRCSRFGLVTIRSHSKLFNCIYYRHTNYVNCIHTVYMCAHALSCICIYVVPCTKIRTSFCTNYLRGTYYKEIAKKYFIVPPCYLCLFQCQENLHNPEHAFERVDVPNDQDHRLQD